MKKKLSIVSILLVLIIALCVFAACGKGTAKVTVLESEGEVLVIRADETKEDVSFGDVLQNLKKSGKIQFEAKTTEYGLSPISVNGRTLGDNEYWAVYTSLSKYKGTDYSSTEYSSYTYNETVCGYANYGVSGLPIIKGNLYILVLETF